MAKLAAELSAAGHRVSVRRVAKLLKSADYSLQGNAKAVEDKQQPDRDAPFSCLDNRADHIDFGVVNVHLDSGSTTAVDTHASSAKHPVLAWHRALSSTHPAGD